MESTMLVLNEADTHKRLQDYKLCSPTELVFPFFDRENHVQYSWHDHPNHQLLYPIAGNVRLQTENASLLLHPQCAAWIPLGVRHRTAHVMASTASIFFAPDFVKWSCREVAAIPAPPLLREMMCAAGDWNSENASVEPFRESYFRTLAGLCHPWAHRQRVLPLPAARTPRLTRAIDYLLLNLRHANLETASAVAAMSTRSLRRHFVAETGLSWRAYVRRLRVQKALELWTDTDLSAAGVGAEVGFESLSAFSEAFTCIVGESPGRYRARIRARKQ
jgi:AraC-like DNA-binding protein